MTTRKPALARIALPLAVVLGLALAAPALADSVATEQQQGAEVLTQIRHGTVNPRALANSQYGNLGEYLMGRALGSVQLHQRMNTLMDAMMGPNASDLMHIYLGKRYLGVSATPTSHYGQLWGLMGVMMSGYRGSALAGMMGAYLNGQGAAGYAPGSGMMGYTPAASTSNTWPTGAIIAVCMLGLLLVVAAIAFAVTRGRRRPPDAMTS
jgi:hypothetical protein